MNKLARFIKDDSGATAIEYGLIAAATGLTLVAVTPALEGGLFTVFTDVSGSLN